jgi:hypothetical protein
MNSNNRKCSSCYGVGHRRNSSYCPQATSIGRQDNLHTVTAVLLAEAVTVAAAADTSSDSLSKIMMPHYSQLVACTLCGNVEHQSNNCPSYDISLNQPEQYASDTTVTVSSQDNRIMCFPCGSQLEVQGNQTASSSSRDSEYCLAVPMTNEKNCTKCGAQGHEVTNCNNLCLPQIHRCFTCGIPGHHNSSKDCPAFVFANRDLRSTGEGDFSNNCITVLNNAIIPRQIQGCANCPGVIGKGHTAISCSVRCNKCHIHGHSEANCDNPFVTTRNWVSKCAVKWSKTCPICGCMFLCSESLAFMKKCCLSGNVQCDWWPELKPLPDSYYQIIKYNEGNFSR